MSRLRWLTCAVALTGCFNDTEPGSGETTSGTTSGGTATTSNVTSSDVTTGEVTTDDITTGDASTNVTSDATGTTAVEVSSSSTGVSCEERCPTGHCDPTGQFCARYVFVTRVAYDTTFGGIMFANAFCAGEAAGQLPGIYSALVSDNLNPDPWANIGYDDLEDAVFVLSDETPVALSPEQLRVDLDGTRRLEAPINLDASEVIPQTNGTVCSTGDRVLTGFRPPDGCAGDDPDCAPNPHVVTCLNWTENDIQSGGTGRFTMNDRRWVGAGICDCYNENSDVARTGRFYCFEQVPN